VSASQSSRCERTDCRTGYARPPGSARRAADRFRVRSRWAAKAWRWASSGRFAHALAMQAQPAIQAQRLPDENGLTPRKLASSRDSTFFSRRFSSSCVVSQNQAILPYRSRSVTYQQKPKWIRGTPYSVSVQRVPRPERVTVRCSARQFPAKSSMISKLLEQRSHRARRRKHKLVLFVRLFIHFEV